MDRHTDESIVAVYLDKVKALGLSENEHARQKSICHIIFKRFHRGNALLTLKAAQRWSEKAHTRNTMSHGYVQRIRCTIRRLTCVLEGDMKKWSREGKLRYRLKGEFHAIGVAVEKSTDWANPTHRNVIVVSRAFLFWLQKNGCHDCRGISAQVIRDYLIYVAARSHGAGVIDVKFGMRKFMDFLEKMGVVNANCRDLLYAPMRIARRHLPAFTDEEVGKILDYAQTANGPSRSRNHMIAMIGAYTGLRLSDIVSLRLTDIDWRNGAIRRKQSKTGYPVSIPIARPLGEALVRYILEDRVANGTDLVFCRVLAPHHELAPASMSAIFTRMLARSGVLHTSRDGKSFHALRRHLGSSLVKAGTPLPDVSLILGHTSMASSGRYITVEIDGLRKCALPLDGIEYDERSQLHAR